MKTKTLKKERKFIASLSTLRKNLADTDKRRLQRLKEARDSRNVKRLIEDYTEQQLRPKILDKRQRIAISLLCDFSNQFSDKYIYTRVGVSQAEFYGWKNDPIFIRELDKEITRRQNYMRLVAYKNVFRALSRGSMKDTWNYLKLIGDLRDTMDLRDRTGENIERSDEELASEIVNLQSELANAHTPSDN
jgi:hypothetical protein